MEIRRPDFAWMATVAVAVLSVECTGLSPPSVAGHPANLLQIQVKTHTWIVSLPLGLC